MTGQSQTRPEGSSAQRDTPAAYSATGPDRLGQHCSTGHRNLQGHQNHVKHGVRDSGERLLIFEW